MTARRLRWPSSTAVSLLAALSTWVSLWAWSGFAERAAGFLVPTLGACLLVAVTGALLRSARLAAVPVALGQVLVVGLWLDHRWAAEAAAGGWLPTPTSLRDVLSAVEAGLKAAEAYAAPIPATVSQFNPLMIVLGAGIAVLVDFLACGLRRVPLAGLPLLAVYTVPVSMLLGGVSWWKFAVGAMCYLFLLAADESERLTHWGRQLSSNRVFDSQAGGVSTESLRASARKIGLTATGLAVVIPLFIPTFATGLFGGNGPGAGTAGDSVGISNPMVDLKRDLVRGLDRDVVWVTTPDPYPSYLRISVLDSFDGDSWQPSHRDIPVEQRAQGIMPRPAGLDPSVPHSVVPYSIRVGTNFQSTWLPTPYPIFSIRAPGDWRYDTSTMDFISATNGQTTAGESYRLRALAIRPTAAGLAAAGPASSNVYRAFTALPQNMPDYLRRLARQVTHGARSRFQQAVRLQQWFRADGGFTYSLERSPGNGLDQLRTFLGTGPGSRVGYCEQFAAAMALMGRELGIPSRVAVGFLRPQKIGPHTFVYSTHDLHAWPEMYFEGTGWVRFEPTPQSHTGAAPSYTSQQVPADTTSSPTPSSAPIPHGPNRADQLPQHTDSGASGRGHGGVGAAGVLARALAALLLLALLVLPRTARAWVRRRRWAGAETPVELAEAAWSEVRDSALDLRLQWDDSVTLRTRARSLVQSFGLPAAEDTARIPARGAAVNPEATQALERLVTVVERARYARAVESAGDVAADVDLCVAAMRAGASKRQRTRATWLPASLLAGYSRRGPRSGADAKEIALATQTGVDRAV